MGVGKLGGRLEDKDPHRNEQTTIPNRLQFENLSDLVKSEDGL